MNRSAVVVSISLAVCVGGCATQYSISPVPGESQQIRYEQGTPTTYSEKKLGIVQVSPLGVNEDKRLVFGVAVFNKADAPSNFGVENVSLAQPDGSQDRIFTSADLIHEAKVQAAWAEVGTVLAGAAAGAAAAQSAYTTTSGTAVTPYGSVNYYSRTYDPAVAYEGGAAAGAATGASLRSIKSSLDQTISNVRNFVLQTNTVDPGMSYGGKVIADALSSSTYPQDIQLHVAWNGDDHIFNFVVAEGTAAPVPEAPGPAPVALAPEAAPISVAAQQPPGSIPKTPAVAASPAAPTETTPDQFQTFDQWQKKSGH